MEAEGLRREHERRRREIEMQETEKSERQQLEAENARREDERRRQETEKQELKELEKQRQELIEWLKPFDYNSKHQTATQLRQKDTCHWLLENKTFEDWRYGAGSNFLWLYGIRTSSIWFYYFCSHSRI